MYRVTVTFNVDAADENVAVSYLRTYLESAVHWLDVDDPENLVGRIDYMVREVE